MFINFIYRITNEVRFVAAVEEVVAAEIVAVVLAAAVAVAAEVVAAVALSVG